MFSAARRLQRLPRPRRRLKRRARPVSLSAKFEHLNRPRAPRILCHGYMLSRNSLPHEGSHCSRHTRALNCANACEVSLACMVSEERPGRKALECRPRPERVGHCGRSRDRRPKSVFATRLRSDHAEPPHALEKRSRSRSSLAVLLWRAVTRVAELHGGIAAYSQRALSMQESTRFDTRLSPWASG